MLNLSAGAFAVLPAITAPALPTETSVAIEEKVVRSEDYLPLTDSKNVEKFVKDYFTDIPLMSKIAYCESRNRHFDKSGQVLRGEKTSLDRGVMQINLYFHGETAKKMGLDLHDIDDNLAYARYLYQKQGAKPWMSSSACWSKPDPELAYK